MCVNFWQYAQVSKLKVGENLIDEKNYTDENNNLFPNLQHRSSIITEPDFAW